MRPDSLRTELLHLHSGDAVSTLRLLNAFSFCGRGVKHRGGPCACRPKCRHCLAKTRVVVQVVGGRFQVTVQQVSALIANERAHLIAWIKNLMSIALGWKAIGIPMIGIATSPSIGILAERGKFAVARRDTFVP